MITTNTGAKKLESSDNWREIFPNPGTSAAGAHNASVDAQDRIQAEVAPIINGKRCSLGAASGDYVLLRNSTIAGKTDGAYVAAKAIPANTDLDSTYLGSPITGGISNSLNGKITFENKLVQNVNILSNTTNQVIIDLTKQGYTPIGIISTYIRLYSSTLIYLTDFFISGNNGYVDFISNADGNSGTVQITVMYQKT